VKRFVDIIGAGFGLLLLLPLFLIIAWLIRRNFGSPVFFQQVRPGLKGKSFRMVKFRTMTDKRDSTGELFSDEARMTPLGQLLRAFSLDELPELWNVLKGDMSLVGPRPLLMEYLPLYTPKQARRHEVCPGITGWAQVNGRNAISWEEKFKLDVWYVDHRGIVLDLTILWLTLLSVFHRQGINADGYATMSKFLGSHVALNDKDGYD